MRTYLLVQLGVGWERVRVEREFLCEPVTVLAVREEEPWQDVSLVMSCC